MGPSRFGLPVVAVFSMPLLLSGLTYQPKSALPVGNSASIQYHGLVPRERGQLYGYLQQAILPPPSKVALTRHGTGEQRCREALQSYCQ